MKQHFRNLCFPVKAQKVTSENINETIDIRLRDCLGVLNNDELSFKGIETEFKKKGKELNAVLSKATISEKRAISKDAKEILNLYSADERKDLTELNQNLTDLMIHFKPTSKGAVEEAKNRIKAFTSQSVKVDKIIKRHKQAKPETEVSDTEKKSDK